MDPGADHDPTAAEVLGHQILELNGRIARLESEKKDFWKRVEFWISLSAAAIALIATLSQMGKQYFVGPDTVVDAGNTPSFEIRREGSQEIFIIDLTMDNSGTQNDRIEPLFATISAAPPTGANDDSRINFDPSSIQFGDQASSARSYCTVEKEKYVQIHCRLSQDRDSVYEDFLKGPAQRSIEVQLIDRRGRQKNVVFYFQISKDSLTGQKDRESLFPTAYRTLEKL